LDIIGSVLVSSVLFDKKKKKKKNGTSNNLVNFSISVTVGVCNGWDEQW